MPVFGPLTVDCLGNDTYNLTYNDITYTKKKKEINRTVDDPPMLLVLIISILMSITISTTILSFIVIIILTIVVSIYVLIALIYPIIIGPIIIMVLLLMTCWINSRRTIRLDDDHMVTLSFIQYYLYISFIRREEV